LVRRSPVMDWHFASNEPANSSQFSVIRSIIRDLGFGLPASTAFGMNLERVTHLCFSTCGADTFAQETSCNTERNSRSGKHCKRLNLLRFAALPLVFPLPSA